MEKIVTLDKVFEYYNGQPTESFMQKEKHMSRSDRYQVIQAASVGAAMSFVSDFIGKPAPTNGQQEPCLNVSASGIQETRLKILKRVSL